MLPLLPLLLAVSPPPAFERTYSFWLGSERVGSVAVRFDGARYRYESTRVVRRAGSLEAQSFSSETDAQGVGTSSTGRRLPGPMPSTLALLMFAEGAARRCLAVEDEQDGHPGRVCAERRGGHLSGELLGEPFTAILGADGAPDRIEFPQQPSRFVAEAGPLPLPQPRDLFGQPIAAPTPDRLGAPGARLRAESPSCQAEWSLPPSEPGAGAPVPSTTVHGPFLDAAADATRGDRTAWGAARHLAEFVDRAIESVPPDLDEHDAAITWHRRRGGCVGHAAVFNELARALGLRTRIAYGLLFEDGEWRSHAWSEVEIAGRFYGLDPSRGGAPLGPEHVALARDDDPDPLRPGRCLLGLSSMRWTLEPASSPAR